MLVMNSKLLNTPIMSLQSGDKLGATGAPIIDPRKLQITAFYALGNRITELSVLHCSDIREVGPLGMIVDSADEIMPLNDDLLRLKELLDMKFELIGLQVIDDNGMKLGKVSEFSTEINDFFIQKIYVTKTFLKSIASSDLIINRAQIIEITNKKIVVKSAAIQSKSSIEQVVNPFRKQNLATERSAIDQ